MVRSAVHTYIRWTTGDPLQWESSTRACVTEPLSRCIHHDSAGSCPRCFLSRAVASRRLFFFLKRDEDANTASDRARKFQREASDLRRKLEVTTTTSSNSKGTGGGASRASKSGGENTVRFSGLAEGEGGEGREGDRFDQVQEEVELKKEVGWLRRELEEQRDACAVAKGEADELNAMFEEVSVCCKVFVAGQRTLLSPSALREKGSRGEGAFLGHARRDRRARRA